MHLNIFNKMNNIPLDFSPTEFFLDAFVLDLEDDELDEYDFSELLLVLSLLLLFDLL